MKNDEIENKYLIDIFVKLGFSKDDIVGLILFLNESKVDKVNFVKRLKSLNPNEITEDIIINIIQELKNTND